MLEKNYSMLCSYKEAIHDMKILDAIRVSNKKKKWIKIK